MTKQQAIDLITAKLHQLDDDRVQVIADLVQSIDDDEGLQRDLTDDELALIENSREDFRAGRTLTSAEVRASINAFFKSSGAAKS